MGQGTIGQGFLSRPSETKLRDGKLRDMGLPSRLLDARPWESTLLDRACLAGFPKEHRGRADY